MRARGRTTAAPPWRASTSAGAHVTCCERRRGARSPSVAIAEITAALQLRPGMLELEVVTASSGSVQIKGGWLPLANIGIITRIYLSVRGYWSVRGWTFGELHLSRNLRLHLGLCIPELLVLCPSTSVQAMRTPSVMRGEKRCVQGEHGTRNPEQCGRSKKGREHCSDVALLNARNHATLLKVEAALFRQLWGIAITQCRRCHHRPTLTRRCCRLVALPSHTVASALSVVPRRS